MKHAMRSLAVIFVATALSATPADDAQGQTPEHETAASIDPTGLWKVNRFDIVMGIKKCPEKEICPTIHWIAENERDVYNYFGPSHRERQQRGIRTPTRENILELCGQYINFDMTQDPNNPLKRKGRVHLPGKGFWASMSLELKDNNTADVTISKFWIKERDTWTRIPPSEEHRYRRCAPQKPPARP